MTDTITLPREVVESWRHEVSLVNGFRGKDYDILRELEDSMKVALATPVQPVKEPAAVTLPRELAQDAVRFLRAKHVLTFGGFLTHRLDCADAIEAALVPQPFKQSDQVRTCDQGCNGCETCTDYDETTPAQSVQSPKE